MRVRQLGFLLSAVVLLLVCGQPVMAQTGKLIIRGAPREAYLYADGIPIAQRKGHTFCLTAGEHKIDLYNYGYKPESRTVTIEAHKTLTLDVTMQELPGQVPGPWGAITVKGPSQDAVLLNGKDPAVFFVGNVGEFASERGPKELVVPPGKYDLTVACCNRDPWSTTVDVPANQRVIVDAYKGVSTTVAWSRGGGLASQARFQASGAMVRVAVEKVTGQFNAANPQVDCGGSTHLSWSTTGAGRVEINGEPVSASGDETVQPKQTTDYKFTAVGPGGVYNGDVTVNVNSAIAASLSVSPMEARYHKVGDKVDQTATAIVTWSAPNASTVSVDPFGTVGATGSHDVEITPTNTSVGPVDQTVTYTLQASNACGGTETRTATLHIAGSIESGVNVVELEKQLTFNSIYFPYNLPTVKDPDGGLVPSQGKRLDDMATNFQQYLTARPEANLILGAHADHRGSVAFNKALSERRANVVKNYLVQHGISADKIQTVAYGKEENLSAKQVKDLAEQDPNITPEDRKRVERNIVAFRMANNRRVDLRLSTTGQTSLQYYPYNSEDLNVLLGEQKHVVKKARTKK